MSTDKHLKMIKFVIRPMTQMTEEDGQLPIEGMAHYGMGVLQAQDVKLTIQQASHPHFVRHHYAENRMTKWTDQPMTVVEVQKEEGAQKRVCGSFITDAGNNLIAYCVDSQPSRLAKGNKTYVSEIIKDTCTQSSWEKKL